eukprot:SAG31_NODE_6698_length_1919_cov_26.213736_1_plen_296_part_00
MPFLLAACFISPATKDEQILPADHPLQKVITIMNNEFPVSGSDEKVRSEIAFGITGYDRKGAYALFDYRRNKEEEAELAASSDQPEVVYDDAFDWRKPATLKNIQDTCDSLDGSPFVKADKSPDCLEEPCEQLKTACVVKELGAWLNRTATECEGEDGCKAADAVVPDDDILGRSGTYISNYNIPGDYFEKDCFSSGTLCIPEDKANMALWDFYNEKWKEVVDGGVGFTDSQDPNSRVKYVILQFSLDMKRRAYYTNSEAMAIYTQVDDFVNNMALDPSVGFAAQSLFLGRMAKC